MIPVYPVVPAFFLSCYIVQFRANLHNVRTQVDTRRALAAAEMLSSRASSAAASPAAVGGWAHKAGAVGVMEGRGGGSGPEVLCCAHLRVLELSLADTEALLRRLDALAVLPRGQEGVVACGRHRWSGIDKVEGGGAVPHICDGAQCVCGMHALWPDECRRTMVFFLGGGLASSGAARVPGAPPDAWRVRAVPGALLPLIMK